jgi:hypothetical protein
MLSCAAHIIGNKNRRTRRVINVLFIVVLLTDKYSAFFPLLKSAHSSRISAEDNNSGPVCP